MKPAPSISERLRRWLRGDANRREEADLEREAGKDPFLEEALRGFRQHPEADHEAALRQLRSRLSERQKAGDRHAKRSLVWLRPLLAAAILAGLAVALGWLYYPRPGQPGPELAQEGSRSLPDEQLSPPPAPPDDLPAPAETDAEPDAGDSPMAALSAETAEEAPPPPAQGRKPADEVDIPVAQEEFLAKQPAPQARTRFAVPAPQARPQGGLEAWNAYLEKNQRFPDSARQAAVKGVVKLLFTAYAQAPPGRIEVRDSLGFGCDAEAVRLLREGPAWIPPDNLDSLQSEVQIPFPADFLPSAEEKNNN